MLKSVVTKARTYVRLGLRNIARIAVYRLALRSGIYKHLLPIVDTPSTQNVFFPTPNNPIEIPTLAAVERQAILTGADNLLAGKFIAFSRHLTAIEVPPNWSANILNGKIIANNSKHWSEIPDFSNDIGEIKTVWEISRCDWAVLLAMAWRISGKDHYLKALNIWLDDWDKKNPPNQGANWKCGQETSIRVLHILQANLIINEGRPTTSSQRLDNFVANHTKRIASTLSYAIAQDNNHATTEAAALFVCGNWLNKPSRENGKSRKQYQRWAKLGRSNLEERMSHLVLDDGTFSQYSPTYQRVLLATLVQVLVWQELLDQPQFSKKFLERSKLALEWLVQMSDPQSGDCPNLGANDGANIFRLSLAHNYRDFRPAIAALAHRLKIAGPHYGIGDIARQWLPNLKQVTGGKTKLRSFNAVSLSQGGFEKLVSKDRQSWALLRTAKFQFRPPHADINHVDLWHKGKNILMDSGTYSYAGPPPNVPHELKSVDAHNTITFDEHDQMPELGRFLYGDWPTGRVKRNAGKASVESSVLFPDGNAHKRQLQNLDDQWIINDELKGTFKSAVMRWHLPDFDWRLAGNICSSDKFSIEIECLAGEIENIQLVPSIVSRYYLESEPCAVLEVTLKPTVSPVKINTIVQV